MKRRETGNWQRRWCVLTERDMEYYHSRQVTAGCGSLAGRCRSLLVGEGERVVGSARLFRSRIAPTGVMR